MVVIAEKGPVGATVGEIARAAHVSSGTFYNHFLSIENLVDAIAGELGTAVEIGRDTLTVIENDPAMRVLIGSAQLLRLVDDDPASASAFVALLATVPMFRDRVRLLVSGALDDGITSGRFVDHNLMALTDAVLGSVAQWMRTSLAQRGTALRSGRNTHFRIMLSIVGVDPVEAPVLIDRLHRLSDAS
jgi:AcrR family transcriptional regulator